MSSFSLFGKAANSAGEAALRNAQSRARSAGVSARRRLQRAVLGEDALDDPDAGDAGGLVAVELDDERASRGGGNVQRLLLADALDRRVIYELQRGRQNPGLEDARRGGCGGLGRLEERQQRAPRRRERDEAQVDFREDAQRAFGADEEAREVVAGHALQRARADVDDVALRQDDLEAGDVIARDAVLDRAQPAGAFGDVAAERGEIRAGGVGRIEQAAALHLGLEVADGDARLDGGDLVVVVHLEDAVHAPEVERDPAAGGHRAAGQPARRAARIDRRLLAVRQTQHAGDFLGGVRERDDIRQRGAARAVVRREDPLLDLGRDALGAEDGPEFASAVFSAMESIRLSKSPGNGLFATRSRRIGDDRERDGGRKKGRPRLNQRTRGSCEGHGVMPKPAQGNNQLSTINRQLAIANRPLTADD